MSIFSDFASKAWEPTKKAAVGFVDLLTPEDNSGVLSGAITSHANQPNQSPMLSITELGQQAVGPGKGVLQPLPSTQKLGIQAMEGAPVYTDSSRQTVYTPSKDDGEGMDLQKLGEVLKSIKSPGTPQHQSTSIGSSRGRGFQLDRNALTDPLVAREYQQLYMAPLYTDLMQR